MKYDPFGQPYVSDNNLVDLVYCQPDLKLENFLVDNPEQFNQSVQQLHADFPVLKKYIPPNIDINEFDQRNQKFWFMPEEYKNLDIARWVLEKCNTEVELQRVGQELLLYQEKNLFPLLCYLKYLVDTLRQNNILWGVGRGSSVASYVLYLIGIHRINSIYYNLPIEEFLK